MDVTFTPLSGAREDSAAPCCYLLTIGSHRLLLDCGWDDEFDPAALEALREVAPSIDAVLLSHGDLAHLGALPYARANFGLAAPVYATLPVRRMGQMCMYDAHASASAFQSPHARFDDSKGGFSLDAVDDVFDGLHELKFAQIVKLKPAKAAAAAGAAGATGGGGVGGISAAAAWNQQVTVSPHPAGHTIGGAFWRIAVGAEEVLYCPEYNHQRERHLPAGVLHLHTKPSLLIAPAREALVAAERNTARAFASYAAAALMRGGDVLAPTDAAGRCLELVQVRVCRLPLPPTSMISSPKECPLCFLALPG